MNRSLMDGSPGHTLPSRGVARSQLSTMIRIGSRTLTTCSLIWIRRPSLSYVTVSALGHGVTPARLNVCLQPSFPSARDGPDERRATCVAASMTYVHDSPSGPVVGGCAIPETPAELSMPRVLGTSRTASGDESPF